MICAISHNSPLSYKGRMTQDYTGSKGSGKKRWPRKEKTDTPKREWQVQAADQGKRLVLFLQEHITPVQSARNIKRLLEQNYCQINGNVERFASRPVKTGDRVLFTFQGELSRPSKDASQDAAAEDRMVAAPVAWQTIYKDNDLIVAQKPAGIAVDNEEGTAALLKEFGEVFLVHRLDKETSGLLLLARNKEILKELEAMFRTHDIEKGYLALVDGLIQEESGEVRNHIGKVHAYEGQSLRGSVSPEQGRLAHTLWRVLGHGKGATLVACQPMTGRTHQIRVHMKGIGHPILGDYQYARSFHSDLRPARCLLHAAELTFTHPRTGERKRYRAHLPADFIHALTDLKVPFARKAQLQLRKDEKEARQDKEEKEAKDNGETL